MAAQTVTLQDKYLGCITGAAAGDALGAAGEPLSTTQIMQIYGGRITDFVTPSEQSLSRGRKAGQVTDAFSIPYFLSQQLFLNHGQASRRAGEEALRQWGESPWFGPFAGMTTRKVVNRLKQDDRQEMWSYAGHLGNKLFKGHYYALSSNGAAVKAWPAALLHPGDVDAAIAAAVELTMASHDDPLSISGACAMAAAVSRALDGNVTLYAITEAAKYGAAEGEKQARARKDIWLYPGPSVSRRLDMSIDVAVKGDANAMEELRDIIGSGPAVAETFPVAIGLLIANQGDVMAALLDGVNIGDETAAIASIIGAIGGAWRGAGIFPKHYLTTVDQANDFDLKRFAGQWLGLLEQEKNG
ncbi:MAG: ADP-ribosylglycohydrolase family protein [Firmicutes bacterium]|nr:ADP-ribosylglycohydrolase family protein [Bacillota bacterium]